MLLFGFLLSITMLEAKPDCILPGENVKLTLSNRPEVGQIAIIKLDVITPFDTDDAKISCFLPPEIEFINDKNYTVKYERFGLFSEEASERWGNRVIFYSGPVKKNDKKEFIFKIRIPSGEKYNIEADGKGGYDTLELDLGEPEPPDLPTTAKEYAGKKEGRNYIKTRIKQLRDGQLLDLTIPEDSLPPLRTELRIRTKDSPDLGVEYSSNPKGPIPFRHLVYVEHESPQVEVNCILPEGFEIVDGSSYKTSIDPEGMTRVLLYSGAMRFKESKAFYFKVRITRPLTLREHQTITETIQVETKLLTQENETLLKTDSRSIDFGRILY